MISLAFVAKWLRRPLSKREIASSNLAKSTRFFFFFSSNTRIGFGDTKKTPRFFSKKRKKKAPPKKVHARARTKENFCEGSGVKKNSPVVHDPRSFFLLLLVLSDFLFQQKKRTRVQSARAFLL